MLDRKDIISEYEQTGSIRAVSRKLKINRKTVKHYVTEYLQAQKGGDESLVAYLKSEPEYKTPIRPKRVLTEEVCQLIDTCLISNARKRQNGDGKLCMKASDIHAALLAAGHNVSYPSVCKYIQITLGNVEEVNECYIRQVYKPGYDCEFDWGELYLTIDGHRTKFYIAVFTLAYSNYRAAYLFLHQDTQAFLESHRQFFHDLGHVPHRMVYDNMRVAVASFVGGKHPTDALIRLEAVYGFRHRFCNARSGNEKGHVERSVEVVRRKAFCQVDNYESITAAQDQVIWACAMLNTPLPIEDNAEEKVQEEYKHMLPLKEEIGCFEQQAYTVDKYGTFVLKGIHYSVPDHLVGKKVNVFIYSNKLKIYYGKSMVAEQERTPVNGWKLDLMHYIKTLQKKPGALSGSAALHMAKEEVKEIFDKYFSEAPSDFITLLQKCKENGYTLEDVVIYCDMIKDIGMQPSLDSYRQVLFKEPLNEAPIAPSGTASSSDIEAHASNGIIVLTGIMNSQKPKAHAARS